ncbi:MAG: SsrA-binding protein [Candidatus Levybacteria bacterium RIFCSPLOWO2_02_FULL_37_10]|nr:MAG: SsrA-binding protein [Candidatus Levybacteria bacterium RIFCSPHIGHO2_01_FULL_37_33]OGH15986.1 MAG: SsrA-binding protein [Candidatus Levybacteria bacterium RIFCSPHIGHO2_02_FULL_37_11]OGH29538.1 MAG: SsrA-binding protein [Candidatus Levybacteria bacterium RIFCSPHIGHO2_12_FULL_37_12]OGH43233.1 MAG: SsrA-binding protein [Candidatus Levybacteria bacterium RIFCSPLOWO2_02_FULL_37_10]
MKIVNKKAFFDYQISERIEAGINLNGAEVKAIRGGFADLKGSFVKIIGSEAYLINVKIFPYQYARPEGYDERRTRKLLLHKKEIIALKGRTEGSNLTIVPLSIYTTKNFIKVELGLGKGKREYQKKEAKKRKDLERSVEQELSSVE